MFYSNVDVLNNKIKKEEWLGDAERFYKEVYKWESPDPWKSNWMEIAELTKIAVTKIDSVSSKDYKKILTDYLRNIFFYTSCKK
jgi:predicted membrane protein